MPGQPCLGQAVVERIGLVRIPLDLALQLPVSAKAGEEAGAETTELRVTVFPEIGVEADEIIVEATDGTDLDRANGARDQQNRSGKKEPADWEGKKHGHLGIRYATSMPLPSGNPFLRGEELVTCATVGTTSPIPL